MSLKSAFITLSISVLLASYLFYAAVHVPDNIEQGDRVFWLFAGFKFIRGLTLAGEFLGLGHKVNLTRSPPVSLSVFDQVADYEHVQATNAVFDGVSVRLFTPDNRVVNGPAIMNFHGGGWVYGSADGQEMLLTELARKLSVLVVSVNYRLAPEFPFPVPFEDCYRATVHFLNNAATYEVDPHRVAVLGESAGGNLAAAVSLRLRDTHHPIQPRLQALVVPCLQAFDFNTPSYQLNDNNAFLPRYVMIDMWLWYAFGPHGHHRTYEFIENRHTTAAPRRSELASRVDHALIARRHIHASYEPFSAGDYEGNVTLWTEIKAVFTDPYFAPLMAGELGGLPETYIATAQWDVLRDDGLMYARRLTQAGVEVELKHYENAFHWMTYDLRDCVQCKRTVNDLVEWLSTHL